MVGHFPTVQSWLSAIFIPLNESSKSILPFKKKKSLFSIPLYTIRGPSLPIFPNQVCWAGYTRGKNSHVSMEHRDTALELEAWRTYSQHKGPENQTSTWSAATVHCVQPWDNSWHVWNPITASMPGQQLCLSHCTSPFHISSCIHSNSIRKYYSPHLQKKMRLTKVEECLKSLHS